MKFRQVLITPEQAAAWLKVNYKNQRLLKPMLVEYLVRCIKQGTWNSNVPQPIMIAETGELIDGQHRLHAIIESGQSVYAWVATDVPLSVYSDVDCGVSRTLHDRVMLTPDAPHANKDTCSVVTSWWFEDHGKRGRPNPEEALSWYRKHEESVRWVVVVKSHERGLGRVHVALGLAQLYERDADKARALASTVYGGDMKRTNGIRLREFLIKPMGLYVNAGGDRAVTRDVYGTVVCVCKAELEGRTLKKLTPARWED